MTSLLGKHLRADPKPSGAAPAPQGKTEVTDEYEKMIAELDSAPPAKEPEGTFEERLALKEDAIAKKKERLAGLVEAALAYAGEGLPVFPVKADKKPATKHGFKDASTDPAKIREMFVKGHDVTGIGLPCGAVSGIVVLDCDMHTDGGIVTENGLDSLKKFVKEHGKLPKTRTVQNGGSEGFHLHYTLPEGTTHKTRDILPGLHVLGDGNYVLLPPSWHGKSDTLYFWVDENVPRAPFPDILRVEDTNAPKPEETATGTQGTRSGGTLSDNLGLRIQDVAMPENPVKTSEGWQGGNPWHGSTTGQNFCINVEDNVWFCHRAGCKCGGDPVSAIWNREFGTGQCVGHLTTDQFLQVKEWLRDNGYRREIDALDAAHREKAREKVFERTPTREEIQRWARASLESPVIYDGDLRLEKYTTVLIAERLGYVKRVPATFPKKRCNPSLTEDEILQAQKNRDATIAAIRKSEQSLQALIKTTPDCAPDIHEEAVRVLKEEDVFEYFLQEYRKRHIGNEKSLKIMLIALVCPAVEDTQGIFPKASGVKGAGKSSGFYAAAALFHPRYVLQISCSPKALFYAKIPEGCMIILDDTTPNDDLTDLFKRKMSVDYHRESVHITVVNGEPEKKTMPPGIIPVFTSVTDSKSDQLIDRQFIVALDKNTELDRQYSKFVLELAGTGYQDLQTSRETLVCREITRILKERSDYQVVIPFSKRIQFSDGAQKNRRGVNTFLDIVRTHATIYSRRRKTDSETGMILANEEDFQFAVDIMDVGELRYSIKLTKSEETVWHIIVKNPGITQNEIAQKLTVSRARITQILHGEGKNNSGLADKTPLTSEEVYDRDKGTRSIQWTAVGTIDEREVFATLLPE